MNLVQYHLFWMTIKLSLQINSHLAWCRKAQRHVKLLTLWVGNILNSESVQGSACFKSVCVFNGTIKRKVARSSSRDHQAVIEEEQTQRLNGLIGSAKYKQKELEPWHLCEHFTYCYLWNIFWWKIYLRSGMKSNLSSDHLFSFFNENKL